VLREIRSTDGSTGGYDADLPVVVLSGGGTEADRVRGFAEGADDYLVKPSRCSSSREGGAPGRREHLPLGKR
jgi:DNA-binding response OmpR family regulator